ncbi:hypothetical protein H181DRAFT_01785 [Streptomyces sp. WMMB 714]|uniref:hypothetical protein n=1 Tax=Streptomyces sp. WMMB 714 TaxID=1286822 RepID=UPI0005F77AD0|nr:hypothetical protein [Streptomyces sp. WMMB 714]SCK23738.1 hypothetical protein H181DRAFT_01785 [Streptomyces sp. WMMB 714]
MPPSLLTSSAAGSPQLTDVVPYITAWSSERIPAQPVVAAGPGIGFADETLHDRDRDGVLWTRVGHSPGRGRPEFGRVHALRQRRAMRKMLCQVCGGAADQARDGVLWVIGEEAADSGSLPDDLTTTHPPVCGPCAARAVRVCPHLRQRSVTLRVRRRTLVGVHGALYQPGHPHPTARTATGVTYDDTHIHWTRAGQLVARLDSYTVEDPARL